MRNTSLVRRFSASAAALLAWAVLSQANISAGSSERAASEARASTTRVVATNVSSIRIGNFGQVDDHYFRGAQPTTDDYRDLAAIGVKTVIDLQNDGRDDEAGLVRAAGMSFYRIPLTTTSRPSPEAVAEFMKLVNDSANQPVFVHCAGGRHRTGAMTAVYRMTQSHWTADQAYAEMKKYRFEGVPGHPELKSFVYDFFKKLASPTLVAQ